MLPDWGIASEGHDPMVNFFVNYAFAALYLFILFFSPSVKIRHLVKQADYLFLFLVMGLISCFSLNRDLPIFQKSVEWLQVVLLVVSLAMMAYPLRKSLPYLLRQVLLLLLGAGLVLFTYFALYLLPFYLVGTIGAIALGIGLHIFIPACTVVLLFLALGRECRKDPSLKIGVITGMAIPIITAVVFLVMWQDGKNSIQKLLNEQQISQTQDLPRWVSLSQNLSANPIHERLIKTDLVYQAVADEFAPFQFPEKNFDELMRHDPLVILATRLLGKPNLETNERVKILESMYDARHHAQERLWSGDHLGTSNVITQAQIFPEYRLSYTEKTLTVDNHKPGSWGQEEGIYTFYLPEGSVVTSLSLWINGIEEKGYLTTQSKADTAYKTIVGVEARDPSVVHWQEGNTVSVRIFPVLPQSSRRFKIGVTSPLRQEGNELIYENIYFDGPSVQGASETIALRVENGTANLNVPASFESKQPGHYTRYSSYEQDWSVSLPVTPLSAQGFTFGGFSYQLQPHAPVLEPFQATEVYLDVNAAWTEHEWDTVWPLLKDKTVYVYANEMTRLTEANRDQLFSLLQQQTFSLFPLHHIKNPAQALVISKGTGTSPNFKDIKDSRFSANFSKTAQNRFAVRYFNIGHQLSPYGKTLRELKLLQYTQGTLSDLNQLLTKSQFPAALQDPNAVQLAESGLKIVRTVADKEIPANGPDHLMRLFAYNHLLQQIGPKYFEKEYLETHLIDEAAQANVVSPLSSLVVLEQQEDMSASGLRKARTAWATPA
ncbi:hypothetical protein GCM10023183_11230 [Nibribacter koreensis]|uniref:VIT domain-containing protein n=2 Tax=Nibribacter koreensis TaxID=1084519 RepID=A0ABP8FDG5_9BACT